MMVTLIILFSIAAVGYAHLIYTVIAFACNVKKNHATVIITWWYANGGILSFCLSIPVAFFLWYAMLSGKSEYWMPLIFAITVLPGYFLAMHSHFAYNDEFLF